MPAASLTVNPSSAGRGKVDSVKFLPEERQIMFVVASDVTTIGAERLMALLIANCRHLGIPLPRSGALDLQVLPVAIALRIGITISAPPPRDRKVVTGSSGHR